MPASKTQTCMTAWPALADLGYPPWVLHSLPAATGISCAATLTTSLRLAVIWESIWWGIAGTFLSALGLSCVCILLLPGSNLCRALRGIYNGIRRDCRVVFMLCGGSLLAANIIGAVYSVQHIGIGLLFVLHCTGNLLGSLVVEARGVGWNIQHSLSLLYLPGFLLFVLGLFLVSHGQIMSPHECATSGRDLAIFGSIATCMGTLTPFESAANSELAKFLKTPMRAVFWALICAVLLMVPLASVLDLWFLRSMSLGKMGWEVCCLLIVSGMSLIVVLMVGLVVSPQIGSPRATTWSVLWFIFTALPLYYFQIVPLPPRPFDTVSGFGILAIVCAAVVIHIGGTRSRAIGAPSKIFEREGLNDDSSMQHLHCETCLRNDRELFAEGDTESSCDPEPWAHAEATHQAPTNALPPSIVTRKLQPV